MKNITKAWFTNILAITALAASLAGLAHAQSALQFTGVKATEEGANLLSWQSEPNTVYRIDYADQVIDPVLGYTVWNTLYDKYPSHGTNTFWLDTGNYSVEPPIPHPKYTASRFYRIFNEGTNSGETPLVSITSPASGSVLSDGITVSVTTTSSYPYVTTKLYVDGQEMSPSKDGATYFINTCEWPNGPHTLFATARALSDYPGPNGYLGILTGRGVSAYVPVTFSNLIAKVAFSQWFFEPSLWQTQRVTAAFAAPVNWTLQIVDDSSNAVRTVTGSGGSLLFNWDGTGDGGAAIPDGIYHYVISAQTNGQAFQSQGSGGSGSDSSPPPLPSVASSSFTGPADSTGLFAIPPDGSGPAVPLVLYPPGFDTNGFTIFEASWSEMRAPKTSPLRARTMDSSGTGGATPMYSGASSDSTSAPTRSPTDPVKNAVSNYGLGYWDYPDGRTLGIPGNGMRYPATGHVHLDGSTSSSASYDWLEDGASVEGALAAAFRARGWKEAFVKGDGNLSAQDIRRSDQGYGGGELFTGVTIGVLLSHGSYGTDPDYSGGSSASKQIYFPSGNGGDSGDNAWLRMCQFGFGGSLKWMALGACNSLCDPNYGSMSSVGAIPLKTTHLLCGATTPTLAVATVYQDWGDRLLAPQPETVVQAWFDAGKYGYQFSPSNQPPIILRVTGYPECMGDYIATNTPPNNPSPTPRNLVKQDRQVWP